MTDRRNFRRSVSEAVMDDDYGPRVRGGISLKITIAVISFIGALIFQGGTFIWWASQQASRLTQVETAQVAMQSDLRADQTSRNDMNTHLASIEQNIKDLRDMWFNRPTAVPQQVYVPAQAPAGQTIINTAPNPAQTVRPVQPGSN
jgi:hypothetical protein